MWCVLHPLDVRLRRVGTQVLVISIRMQCSSLAAAHLIVLRIIITTMHCPGGTALLAMYRLSHTCNSVQDTL